MTGPLDESDHAIITDRPPRRIRIVSIGRDAGPWHVDYDTDDDRREDEDPSHVRLYVWEGERAITVTVPLEILEELAEVIGEL